MGLENLHARLLRLQWMLEQAERKGPPDPDTLAACDAVLEGAELAMAALGSHNPLVVRVEGRQHRFRSHLCQAEMTASPRDYSFCDPSAKPGERYSTPDPATVNWSCIGPVPVIQAQTFAIAVLHAARVAAELPERGR